MTDPNSDASDSTVRLPLELSRDRGWGRVPKAPGRIQEAVILGRPLIWPITKGRFGDDKELRLFLPKVGQAARFYHVTFSCTFVLPDPWRFSEARVRVVLEGAGGSEPIAQRMDHRIESRFWTESGNLDLGGISGVPFKTSHGLTRIQEEVTVSPQGEGTSCPEWHLRQRVPCLIGEPPRFTLVIDVPPGTSVNGTAVLGADLIGPAGIRREYRVPLEETRTLNWLQIGATHPK